MIAKPQICWRKNTESKRTVAMSLKQEHVWHFQGQQDGGVTVWVSVQRVREEDGEQMESQITERLVGHCKKI